MADVKICDRCGKRLSDTKRAVFSVKSVRPARFTLNMTLFKTDAWCDLKSVETSHDLCMECVQKLSDWMTDVENTEE